MIPTGPANKEREMKISMNKYLLMMGRVANCQRCFPYLVKKKLQRIGLIESHKRQTANRKRASSCLWYPE